MSDPDLFEHNRLSPYERGIIERAERAEHHRLHKTGAFRDSSKAVFDFIAESRRDERRAKAAEARNRL